MLISVVLDLERHLRPVRKIGLFGILRILEDIDPDGVSVSFNTLSAPPNCKVREMEHCPNGR
jgi:hypothetical protein